MSFYSGLNNICQWLKEIHINIANILQRDLKIVRLDFTNSQCHGKYPHVETPIMWNMVKCWSMKPSTMQELKTFVYNAHVYITPRIVPNNRMYGHSSQYIITNRHLWTYMYVYLIAWRWISTWHYYSDVIMSTMAPQIIDVSIVCPTVCLGADKRKHQSSASLASVGGNPPVTGGFPSQRFSNASWWRRHDYQYSTLQMSRQARQTTFIMLCWSEHHFHEVYLSLYGLIIDCRTRHISEMILGLHPANERRRYKVTLSLIGWTQT